MQRRAFLTGLFGVAGAVALAGLGSRPAEAVPLARALGMPKTETAGADGARAPDGTPVEKAQAMWRDGRPPGWWRRRRRWRRRRSRLVCRTYRRRGRWIRRCRRVFWR